MTTFAEVKRIESISARRQFASTEPFCELSVAFSRRRDRQSGPWQGRKSESFASFDGISSGVAQVSAWSIRCGVLGDNCF